MMMKLTKMLFAAALALMAVPLSACGGDDPEVPDLPDVPVVPDTPDIPDTPAEERLVVGYYPTWSTWWGEPDYDKLSIMCIAFAEMRGDGHLYYDGAKALASTIRNARAKGVKVLISLRDAQNVSDALASTELREQLADEVKTAIDELGIDGVDVDYEEWGGDEAAKRANLEQFYIDIRSRIGNGKLLTAALGGKTAPDPSINAEMLTHLDYVFPMIYDQCGGWEGGGWGAVGQHSGYEYYQDVIRFYTGTLKVPAEKLCAGLPFYGYEFKSATSTAGAGAVAYRELFDRYPGQSVHMTDNVDLIWYNGIPTIQKKCRYAAEQNIGGVMIWELSQDTRDESTSLLNAVSSVFGARHF